MLHRVVMQSKMAELAISDNAVSNRHVFAVDLYYDPLPSYLILLEQVCVSCMKLILSPLMTGYH